MTNGHRLVRVKARPQTNYISHGRTVLATALDGQLHGNPDEGLFVHETRVLSQYRYFVDDEPLVPNVLSNVEQHSWLGYYICVPPGVDAGERDRGSGMVPPESQQTLELRVSRFAGGGLHEDLDLSNFSRHTIRFRFTLEVDADFADLSQTRERGPSKQAVRRRWTRDQLRFRYRAKNDFDHQGERGTARIDRGITIAVSAASSSARHRDGQLHFDVKLAPQQSWHTCLDFVVDIDGEIHTPLHRCRAFGLTDHPLDVKTARFLNEATRFDVAGGGTLTGVVTGALEQARYDLPALRLFDLDSEDGGWTMAAGLPLYVALYGRDTLTTGWQAGLLTPDMMNGVLQVLAREQGTTVSDWHDEQPGRMLHEMHTGPSSTLNMNSRARSYGSMTTSSLYGFIAAELWHWTGEKSLVSRFLDPALAALEWLDSSGDPDRDGLYEYRTRSNDGVRNQGWKDSSDAIVHHDGRLAELPIATCEEQGYVYVTKLHLSETLWWLGRKREARRLFGEARRLKKRFNAAFWSEQLGFFAMALDGKKQQVRSIGSNAGHCIATAICSAKRVRRVADRLFRDDLFTGWGIRTLSSKHPSFNPYSYHLGSVWPVEHGTFALGLMRYGLHDRVQQLARAQFDAAALFDFYRLPELFSGHPRDDDHPFPAVYPNSNSPQAWSASSVFCLLQALLGLYPYAPLNVLIVDPHLPEWLPEITLSDLRVGDATVTIRFRRRKDGSSTYTILRKRGRLHVIRQPTPWSLTATWAERLRDWLISLLPRK